MINLAPIRYSKAMISDGGPIARMEHSFGDVFGEACVHAVTFLKEGIVNSQYLKLRVTDQPDGAGCHATAQVACYMAISEAMERWAVHYCRERVGSGLGGMDLDGSSNGFAAYPGLFRRQARRFAYRESIERHCLICWWEGLLGHCYVEGPWPGVTAISIDNPFSSHAVVVLWTMTGHGQAYAFGAGDNVKHATRRAQVELDRTRSLLKHLFQASLPLFAQKSGDVFERRISYFSKGVGMKLFLERLRKSPSATVPRHELLFDAAVRGPWDSYASVWRTIIEAPSREYLTDAEDYFFW
jgi:hypothetical protein